MSVILVAAAAAAVVETIIQHFHRSRPTPKESAQ